MNQHLLSLFEKLKTRGLSREQEQRMMAEIGSAGDHDVPEPAVRGARGARLGFYEWQDLPDLQSLAVSLMTGFLCLRSIDELLERDRLREKDGFPRKVRVGRLIKPGKGGKDKVVVVPTTVEEKFLHDTSFKAAGDEGASGGTGEGQEGEVIGKEPVRDPSGAGSQGPGQGEGGPHEMESSAYDLGKILTEKFELPNLKDKGKKRSFTRYSYDLTDRHRRFGQILDKKATMRRILRTNILMGRIPDASNIDASSLIISPDDKVYRILSREKDYESQAMVFFVRDYSGSMSGKPTDLVVAQHVLIYSWLLYQYARQVESRFILHDTEAKEVPDFYTYYNSRVAGGTQVASAYKLVNEIVDKENLRADYNIYVFHGTDGDDWDTGGENTIPELAKIMSYAARVGITIARESTGSDEGSEMERYVRKSRLLEEKAQLVRMDVIPPTADEPRLIQGIKKLIS